MRQIAPHISDLLSSNINGALDRAIDPIKMLDLLHAELQGHAIRARAELARTLRDRKSRDALAAECEELAREWFAKANIALAHQREDLAHAALAEREQMLAVATEARQAAQQATLEAGQIMAQLEEMASQQTEVTRRIAAARASVAANTSAAIAAAGRTGRRQPRIDRLEERLSFAAARVDEDPLSDTAALRLEFEQLQRSAKVEEELQAIKAQSAAAGSTDQNEPD